MGLLARLSRMIPLIIALALVAAIIYVVFTYLHSPARAKEVLIKVFTWLTGLLSAFFGLATLYALFESNSGVLDLAGSFLVVTLVALAITRFCNYRFLKHHPSYRKKPTDRAHTKRFPWQK